MINDKTITMLIDKAQEMRNYSYVPYSHFRVGAALLDNDGHIHTGCNIENASYSATNCAERTAFFKAISEGIKDFEAICIIGGFDDDPTDYAMPCGVCRQVMLEFCKPDFKIIVAKNKSDYKIYDLVEMMPHGFNL